MAGIHKGRMNIAFKQSDPITSTPKRALVNKIGTSERKRPLETSPSDLKNCTMCNLKLTKENSLNCSCCMLGFCKGCSGMSNKAFELLLSGELGNCSWACRSCKRTLPTLESMDKTLRELNEKQDLRLCALENQMETLEMRTENKIQAEAIKIKNEVTEDVQANVKAMVEERCREMDDRRRRELNIVMFNMPESYNIDKAKKYRK